MARIKVDPGKAEDSVPAGEYEVMILDVEERKPKSNDSGEKFPYLNVTMKVIAGEYEGRVIFDLLSLSPKSQFKLNAFCKALGYAPGEQEMDTDEWTSRVLVVAAKELEEYKGAARFRPKRYIMHPSVLEQVKKELEGKTPEGAAAPAAPAPVQAPKVGLPGRNVVKV